MILFCNLCDVQVFGQPKRCCIPKKDFVSHKKSGTVIHLSSQLLPLGRHGCHLAPSSRRPGTLPLHPPGEMDTRGTLSERTQLKGAGSAICGATRHGKIAGRSDKNDQWETLNGIDARGPSCDLNKCGVPVREWGSQNCVSTTRDTVACLPCPPCQPRRPLQRPTEPNLEPRNLLLPNDWCKC